jgi:hypothetical protein|tara:strand:- start:2149 stop:2583 length:435 start_codon:yes stop_codon:yes gene_type:complete
MAKGALLEKNSGAGGLLSNVEHITAAKTIVESDSGKVFMVSSEGGAYTITLPTASTAQNGAVYKFIVHEETPTNDVTIAAGSAIISLVMKDAGGDAANSTAGTQVSNIILEAASQRGDFVELLFWNGEYYANGLSAINDGITTS